MLASANLVTSLTNKKISTECIPDFADETDEQPVPAPAEEDTSGEDDDLVKLILQRIPQAFQNAQQPVVFASQFLTSFHFLEIISPPPQQ
ncbi:MAG: hypothetical protein KF856_01130 [Cyclobacteriaceae bacterium]|nr:hypothetical protein [Cyclobacteriaceae bacterium]